MDGKNVSVALDVGTTKVCTTIGFQDEDGIEILGVGSHPSYGLKKGSVVNIDKTVKSIRCSLEEAKMMAGVEDITSATIGIAGNHIYCFNSSGVVAVKNSEITQKDVDRVLEAAKAVLIPSDREVLHVIPQEFRVDSTKGVKNPIGMCGSRLEAHVHVVTGKTSLIQNILKCVEASGIKPNDIILQPIASSRSVLTAEEKDLGVVLIDIGGGTTDIAVWKGGSLIHSQIVPVGGNHFTNDLAVALKIPHNEAERVKINHGSVLAEKLNQSAHITVHGLSGTKAREVQLGEVAKVLGARAEELFVIVKNIVKDKNLSDLVTGGYIITGGGALIKDLAELGEYILEKPTKVGYPRPFGGMTTIMQNPKFSTVLGLLLESSPENMGKTYKKKNNKSASEALESGDIFGRFSDSLRNVFKEIF
ncbi:MAG: cell division protein FtsA [Halobacteriovoraceae bacterium]|nr:cell division protein FtsA [Halobacteriovoraceae bacterium]|tara:strand:+ start:4488 stop:5744 length:1257 start_codon:yes stop_codon:yes gene_type:complete